jgi:hypothetical protein
MARIPAAAKVSPVRVLAPSNMNETSTELLDSLARVVEVDPASQNLWPAWPV